MAHRLLLDTPSLGYRAFFALPRTITDGAGRSVNAVRGYLDMTTYLLTERRPDEIVHVFDHDWRPAPRVAAYEPYKSHRPDDPPELGGQFELLDQVLEAAGAERAFAEGWEADDAIATLAEGADPTDRVDVVTGDRDLLQLVRDEGPAVRLLYTLRGVSELGVFDEAAVMAKYRVPPSRYADFAILRGDPSDGLPGVPGVGEKSAATLVRKYPSVPALVADARSQTPRVGQNLLASKEYLEAMELVVPVRRDVEVTRRQAPRDDDRLRAIAEERSLGGAVERLLAALDGSPG